MIKLRYIQLGMHKLPTWSDRQDTCMSCSSTNNLCPCFLPPASQYLLHLHVVSQLHAVDGGTTYGLSYDKLLPVAPACPFGVGGEERSPMELSCDGLWTALTVWRMDMVSERTWRCPVLPLAAPNVSVTLLLRMARVALDSWKREHHRASHRRGLRGSSQTRPTPAAVLHPASCLDVALSALRRARDTVAAWPASVCDGTGRRGSGGSGGNGGSGASGPLGVRYGSGGGDLGGGGGNSSSGSGADPRVTASGGGGGSGDSNGRSEGVAAKDNGSSALSADGGGTGEGVERGAARAGGGGGVAGSREGVWLSSAQPRQFAGTWWTLVVEAVHAQLEDRTIKSDKTVFTDAVRMLLLLRLEWVRPQPPPAAATASGTVPGAPGSYTGPYVLGFGSYHVRNKRYGPGAFMQHRTCTAKPSVNIFTGTGIRPCVWIYGYSTFAAMHLLTAVLPTTPYCCWVHGPLPASQACLACLSLGQAPLHGGSAGNELPPYRQTCHIRDTRLRRHDHARDMLAGFGPSRPPRTWLSDAIAAGYIPCLEAFTREMMLPTSRDSGPLASRVPALLELLQGLWLRVLAACGEERQAAALLVTAIKATAVLAGQDATRRRALQTFADIPGALAGAAVDWAGVTGAEAQTNPGRLGGSPDGPDSPADDGDGAESSKQPVAPHQPARLLSLCLARWLPLCSKLLPQERDDIDTAARSGLLAAGRRMVRLAGLAQAAAEGRGDARAAESWGRLLGACGSMGEGEQQAEGEEGAAPPPAGDGDGDGSRAAGDAERGFPALAALLVAPCDVGREVLPTCSNPLCMKPLTASEAYVKLCPCKGKCGGTACSGKGPCCCHLCAKKAEWRGCM